jgi:hypothetical protein
LLLASREECNSVWIEEGAKQVCVCNGNVEERFNRFTDVSSYRSASSFFNHAIEILNDFQCGLKLFAQTCDGSALMVSQHAAEIREYYPNYFVRCYVQRLNVVF